MEIKLEDTQGRRGGIAKYYPIYLDVSTNTGKASVTFYFREKPGSIILESELSQFTQIMQCTRREGALKSAAEDGEARANPD